MPNWLEQIGLSVKLASLTLISAEAYRAILIVIAHGRPDKVGNQAIRQLPEEVQPIINTAEAIRSKRYDPQAASNLWLLRPLLIGLGIINSLSSQYMNDDNLRRLVCFLRRLTALCEKYAHNDMLSHEKSELHDTLLKFRIATLIANRIVQE
jgi:hypothetical protein